MLQIRGSTRRRGGGRSVKVNTYLVAN